MSETELSLILEPHKLEAALGNPDLLVVDLCQHSVYEKLHVPGAIHVSPAELICGIPPAPGKLPDEEKLETLFSRIGLKDSNHVVAYDDEGGGWAGRFLWTLEVIGHNRYSLLNGGLHAWANEGHPVTTDIPEITPAPYPPVSVNHDVVADIAEILESIGQPGFRVWDARSAEEYAGARPSAIRNGHIPGAVNLDWLDTMDRQKNLRLLPLEQLRQKLKDLGIDNESRVVTHCQTHHRSGLTYIIGKALGLDIKAYDGSWSEWGNRQDTPVET